MNTIVPKTQIIMRWFKVYCFLVIFLSSFVSHILFAQDSVKRGYVQSFISIGYSVSNLNDPRDYLDKLLDTYRYFDIPISKQCDFGKTLSTEIGILLSDPRRFEGIRFGAILGYMYSPAYARYEDYAGTVDVYGSVNSFQIYLVYHKILFEIGNSEMYVRFKPGLDYSTLKITEDLDFTKLPGNDYHSKIIASGFGFCGEITCGFIFPFYSLQCALECGYRLFYLEADGTEEPLTQENNSRKIPFSIDQSGFVLLFSVGLGL